MYQEQKIGITLCPGMCEAFQQKHKDVTEL